MITTCISGGLGNQMFQYAAGRAAAHRLGVALGLDLRWYGPGRMPFDLHRFAVVYETPASHELPPDRKQNPLRYLAWRTMGISPRLLRENRHGYDARILSIKDGTYLKGYWQSERYFTDVADLLRHELLPKQPATGENLALLGELETLGTAVSLHIRRGDYVKDPPTAARHGSCSLRYYEQAVRLVAQQANIDPVVFAFSDDPEWVQIHLKLPCEVRIMRHNDAAHNFEDLRLMSACRHHVIANSSFSWWGAWLNPRPDKIVIAPRRWFAQENLNDSDIVPKDWRRMDV